MNIGDYAKYISSETLMGPNSARVLQELLEKHPLRLTADDALLDLGCGKGLTSLILAKETGAKVYASDLWISEEENGRRFAHWGMADRMIPVCEDANHLHFDRAQFSALVSVDAYHYFAGKPGFFEEKILPYLKSGAQVLIGVPGVKDAYAGRSEELLTPWLCEDAHMFKGPAQWKEIIGSHERIDSVTTWEMDCFDAAWSDWLAADNPYAQGDSRYFDSVIRPYTCFAGICIKLK